MVPKRDSEAATLAAIRDRLMLTADRKTGRAIIGRDGIAIVVTGVLLLALATALLVPQDQAQMLRTFTPEHIEMLGMFDSRAQQRADRLVVVLLAGLALVALVSRRRVVKPAVPRLVVSFVRLLRDNAGVGVLAGVAVCFLLYRGTQPARNFFVVQGAYYPLALLPSARSQLSAMAGGALVVLTYFWLVRQPAIRARADTLKVSSMLLLMVYALTLCVTAFAIPPDLRGFTPEGLSAVEWHYSGNLGAGDHLAAGMPLGRVPLNAGLLSAVLLAGVERALGLFTFGTHIRIVQALQVLSLALITAALWIWYRPRWLPVLLALLLILPWIQPLHVAILYPNQSAWRFLGLAAAVLALVSLYQRSAAHCAAYLGFAAGLALGWNLETGACVSAAFVAFLALRASGRWSGLLHAGLLFGCGLAAAFLLLAIFVWICLGTWPQASPLLASFPLVGQFAGGYGGLRLTQVDPLVCLIFAHALFVAVSGIVSWQQEDLDGRRACRVALATLIVLWSAYYFKGPHFWNAWSLLVLYGFLLGDLLPRRLASVASYPMRRLLTSFGAAALALILLPAILFPNMLAADSALAAVAVWGKGGDCPGRVVSGICLPREQGDALEEKARSLAALLGTHGGAVYLTSNSYFMPLMTGVLPPLQQRDAFELTISHADFDALVAQLARLNPPCLLFDAPDTMFPGSAFHRRFFERLRSALPSYGTQEKAPAWDVRCR